MLLVAQGVSLDLPLHFSNYLGWSGETFYLKVFVRSWSLDTVPPDDDGPQGNKWSKREPSQFDLPNDSELFHGSALAAIGSVCLCQMIGSWWRRGSTIAEAPVTAYDQGELHSRGANKVTSMGRHFDGGAKGGFPNDVGAHAALMSEYHFPLEKL